MTFSQHTISKPFGARPKKCTECGKDFVEGDKYFTRFMTRVARKNVVAHLCEDCYSSLFIVC